MPDTTRGAWMPDTNLPRALKRLEAMDATGLAQAFTVEDGRAVLSHIAALERARDEALQRVAVAIAEWEREVEVLRG